MLRQTALLALALALPTYTLAQVSDDFESGWDQTKWPIYAPDCNQGGSITLDSTVAHSGKNSIKVAGAGGYCGHIFFGTASVPTGDVYVRAWIKMQTALTSSHVSFITMPDSTLGTNKHLRIGGQSQILMYNRESDDATLPDLSPQGIATSEAFPTDGFHCFEYHLGTDGTIETWLDSAVIPGLTTGPSISNANANGWGKAYIPHINGVYFGWESYGGDVNTLWYDDVAISSTRVGCGTGSSSPTTTAKPTTTAVKTTTSSTKITTTSSTTLSTTLSTSSVRITTTASSSTRTTTTTSSSKTTTPAVTTTSSAPTAGQTHYGQCGGVGWTGPTTCSGGYSCSVLNPYYSQCL